MTKKSEMNKAIRDADCVYVTIFSAHDDYQIKVSKSAALEVIRESNGEGFEVMIIDGNAYLDRE